jgi:hypothetical protein
MSPAFFAAAAAGRYHAVRSTVGVLFCHNQCIEETSMM